MGMVRRLGGSLGNSVRAGIGSSVTADENEMTAKSGCRDVGIPGALLLPVILSFEQGCRKQQFRQHDCSDDADHPALASKSPCNRRRDIPLLHDRHAFPFPARDECDPRDSRGGIR
jgi:hypothetical protein